MYGGGDNDPQGKGYKAQEDGRGHVFFLENLFSHRVPRRLITDPQRNGEDKEAESRMERSIDEVGEVHFGQMDGPPIGNASFGAFLSIRSSRLGGRAADGRQVNRH